MNIYKHYHRYIKINSRNDVMNGRNIFLYKDIEDFLSKIGEKIIFFNEISTYDDTNVNKILLEKKDGNINMTFSSYSMNISETEKKVKIYVGDIFSVYTFTKWLNNYIGYNFLGHTIKTKIEETDWEIIEKKDDSKDDINFINPNITRFMNDKNKKIFNKLIIQIYTFIISITGNKKINIKKIPIDEDIISIHMNDFNKIKQKESDLFFDINETIFIYEDLESETEYKNIKESFYEDTTKKNKKMRQQTILDYFKKVNIFNKNNYSSISSDDSSSDSNDSDSSDIFYNKYNICLEDTNREYYLY